MSGELREGSDAIAEAMIAAGCRFFAGYPMTPFTEILEHMAARLPDVGGACVNAESELEAVGMAWGAAATGTRAATGSTGQGLSLMQESIAEAAMAHLPLVIINMARAQGDYFQATRGGGHGDYRTPVLAPMDVPEAVQLTQYAFYLADKWRNPVLFFGDYYTAHTYQSVDIHPIEFGELPPKDWALDGTSSGTGRAKVVSPLGDTKQRDDVGYDLSDYYLRAAAKTAAMIDGRRADGRRRLLRRRRSGRGRVRHRRASTSATPCRRMRAEGLRVGYVRPITLFPFPTRGACAAPPPARKLVAVYENNMGQMVDDVRLSSRRRGAGRVHRRLSASTRRASASLPTTTSKFCGAASARW